MRKHIRQMVEKHYSGVKLAHPREMFEAHRIWDWTADGLIAISISSADPELAQLAYDNGCEDGQYMLIDVNTRKPRMLESEG